MGDMQVGSERVNVIIRPDGIASVGGLRTNVIIRPDGIASVGGLRMNVIISDVFVPPVVPGQFNWGTRLW